jgi:hypothetical protein
MIAAIVRTNKVLGLRVAASVAGLDIEFGPIDSTGKYQRVDVLSAMGGRDMLRQFGAHIGRPMAGKEFKESDSRMLKRPKLESSKVTD